MSSLLQRPLLLACVVFAVLLGAIVLWIVISNSGLNPDAYNP